MVNSIGKVWRDSHRHIKSCWPILTCNLALNYSKLTQNSTIASACCREHNTTKESKVTMRLDQSITGLQINRKGITNAQENGTGSKICNVTAGIPGANSQQNHIWPKQQSGPIQHPQWYHW